MESAPAPSSAERLPKLEVITLETPLQRGEQQIDTLTLRKPKAGELRGLNLDQLISGDVNAALTLLPRITMPPLTAPEVEALDPADFAAAAGAIRNFFMSRAEQAAMARFLGIETENPPLSTA